MLAHLVAELGDSSRLYFNDQALRPFADGELVEILSAPALSKIIIPSYLIYFLVPIDELLERNH